MRALTLYDKLWNSHVVRTESDGTTLLYIDRHLVHEVTSPQAFDGLKLAGRKPWRPDSIVATRGPQHADPALWERGIDDPTSRVQWTHGREHPPLWRQGLLSVPRRARASST